MYANGSTFTSAIHREAYAAISPSRPELSQRGNVVLITGSSGGIGFHIARAFAQAAATTVILTGRRQTNLDEAVATLGQEFPSTSFVGKNIDIADTTQVKHLWQQLDADGIVVDVLVLNAAHAPESLGPILEQRFEAIWADYVTNVGANMIFADLFYHQKKRDSSKKLALINVSSCVIHDFNVSAQMPNYSASKSAGTVAIQQIAKGTSPDDMQVVSFHPGGIFTEAVRNLGLTRDAMAWDEGDLPGQYAVWAASDEAKFLHGRFVWAAWDVDELAKGKIREQIDSNDHFLKVGVVGL